MLLKANLDEMWFYGWLKIPTYFGWKDAQLHAFKNISPQKTIKFNQEGKAEPTWSQHCIHIVVKCESKWQALVPSKTHALRIAVK